MKLERAKGTRDFNVEDKIIRQEISDILRKVFEKYGFNPIETPVLERLDTLTMKYGGGEEIVKEIFKLKDQGNRDLGLRYDLTIPFSRYVGMNPTLIMPFKAYRMGIVFRDGPIKLGRYREFWQCDVDVVGAKSVLFEVEMIKLIQEAFRELKLEVVIKINNRKILDGILDYVGIQKDKRDTVMLTLDKVEKLENKKIIDELKEKGIDDLKIKKLLKEVYVSAFKNKEIIGELKEKLKDNEGLREIEEIFKYIDDNNIILSPSMARGLSYYTGTIFEVYLKKREIKSSLAAGGRYDEIIGKFLGKGDYPALGVSFGLDVITDVLKLKEEKKKKSLADIYIIPIKTIEESLKIVGELRKNNFKVDVDYNGRGISSNLRYCNALGIKKVIIIGNKDLANNEVTIRNMESGEEKKVKLDKVVENLWFGFY